MEAQMTAQLYNDYQKLLFSLAYRMTGSVMDAEDVVQEAFLAVNGMPAEHLQHPKAYLCKIVTNRCIDRIRSASKQRETYVGPWLPEPLVEEADSSGDPYMQLQHKESITTAYLLMLQQLSWAERAVFLLREALQYEYDEIGEIVGKSPANCRQLFSRAKRSLEGRQPRLEADASASATGSASRETASAGASRAVELFIHALANGDTGKLMQLLSTDAALLSDGGGKVTAAVRPISGADRISRFFMGLLAKRASDDFSFRTAVVNGLPGIVTYMRGQTESVISFRVEDGRISDIYIVVNPDKLVHVK